MVPATNTANDNDNNTNATATVNHGDENEEDDDETKIWKQFELYCEEAARKLLFTMTAPPQSMNVRNNDEQEEEDSMIQKNMPHLK